MGELSILCCGRKLGDVLGQADSVYIASDGGRVCRPLIICKNGVPMVTDAHIAKVRGSTVCQSQMSSSRDDEAELQSSKVVRRKVSQAKLSSR